MTNAPSVALGVWTSMESMNIGGVSYAPKHNNAGESTARLYYDGTVEVLCYRGGNTTDLVWLTVPTPHAP